MKPLPPEWPSSGLRSSPRRLTQRVVVKKQYDPLLGHPLYFRCRIIIGIQKGTINFDSHADISQQLRVEGVGHLPSSVFRVCGLYGSPSGSALSTSEVFRV